jgi:predicted acetyltransferase
MELKLQEISLQMEQAYVDFANEWKEQKEEIIPFSASLNGNNFEQFVTETKLMTTNAPTPFVNATTLFLTLGDKIVGAINIRHSLNEYLLNFGGHIGYGICPSERGNGYAKAMVEMTYPFLRKLELKSVLVICENNNIASIKTVESLGGIMENKVTDRSGTRLRRYWMEL